MGSDEAQQLLPSESREHSHLNLNEKSDLQRRRPRRGSASDTEINYLQEQNVVQNPQCITEKQQAGFDFRPVLLCLAAYLGTGALCFFLISYQIQGIKTNSFLDALYFCVVTMTTVGYGDLVPNSSLAKLLACFYVFTGMALGGLILSKAADYVVEKQEIFLVRALFLKGGNEKVGLEELSKEIGNNKSKYKLVLAASVFCLLMIVGTAFLYFVENLDFVDSLYCVCSTVTTLGYGDKSFSTTFGRAFAVFWILSSTICLAQSFAYLAEVYTEDRQRSLAKMVLTRKLSLLDLEAADLDGDKSVSSASKRGKLREMGSCEEQYGDDLPLVQLQLDPVVLEINHLQNQLKEKVKELAICQGEIKALRATEALKDKAIEELRNEVSKLDERLRVTEDHLKQKNLEIKRQTDEKKDALAAQYAAEATLRRVHANQKDEDSIPVDSLIAPLEAEIKMYRNEITTLQEDKKALERLTKSKESALPGAERILQSALERALKVEEVQNQNFDLKRQIEICQEENKILEKTRRQKIMEVERLSQTIQELEEVILANGTTANIVRDYQRQIFELQEEKRTLERELARVKVSASRIANVVANEWKDENDKVMPVRQWLEERRILQAEMQRLKDKLAISERTAKAESQMKEKLNVRLKTLEEGLKHFSSYPTTSNVFLGSPKAEKSNILGFLATSDGLRKRSTSQPRASSAGSPLFRQTSIKNNKNSVGGNLKQESSTKKKNTYAENMLKKGIRASRSKIADNGEKENEIETNTVINLNQFYDEREAAEMKTPVDVDDYAESKKSNNSSNDDVVSGFLYDRLQKDVINLRKCCETKDISLQAKDDEIKMLMKKVDTLTKAMEVEWKKMRREAAAREKECSSIKPGDTRKDRITNSSKGR